MVEKLEPQDPNESVEPRENSFLVAGKNIFLVFFYILTLTSYAFTACNDSICFKVNIYSLGGKKYSLLKKITCSRPLLVPRFLFLELQVYRRHLL